MKLLLESSRKLKAEDPDLILHPCPGLLGVREQEQSLVDVNYLVKLYSNDTFLTFIVNFGLQL